MAKKLLFLLIIIFSFMIIFFKSKVLETRTEKENRGGVEFFVTKHRLNWDNLFNYIKDISRKIADRLPIK